MIIPASANLCTPDQAEATVRRILSCYPNMRAHNPEGYAAALIMALDGQPLAWVEHIGHPATGVAGRCRFLPTVADINDMLREFRDYRVGRADELARERKDREMVAGQFARRRGTDERPSEEDKAAVREMLADLTVELSRKNAKAFGIAKPGHRRTQCEPGASIRERRTER